MQEPLKVFIIDDSEHERFTLKRYLKKVSLDIEISAFNDGEMAIKALSQDQKYPDYIFLDINMPLLDGHDFLKELEKNQNIDHEKLKIFILSSSNRIEDRSQTTSYSFVESYINKSEINEQKLRELFE